MADKTIRYVDSDGNDVHVKAHDNGDGTYSLAVYGLVPSGQEFMMNIPVHVTTDWAIGANVAADIIVAPGLRFPPEIIVTWKGNWVAVTIWEGPANPDAYHVLYSYDAGSGGTYVFNSTAILPSIGATVYIIGIYAAGSP